MFKILIINRITIRTMSSKSSKNKKGLVTQVTTKSEALSPISIDKSGQINLKILAKPGSKINNITDISDDFIGVQISAPPFDGEANKELIKFIAKLCNLKKSDISIDRGNKSRIKTLLFEKDCITKDKLYEILKLNTES